MARYLITGGAGFIGSNLVEELLKRGEYVRVMDNYSTGRRRNLAPFLKDIDLVEGDLRSYHVVQKATRQVDYILHQAALPSVPRSIADPITTHEVNATGTLNLLHAALESHVKRIVYASSSSIYGDAEVPAKSEALTPAPKSPYAVSKLAGENYAKVFYEQYGLETVCLRYFNVFGPRQDPDSAYSAVIPLFLKKLSADLPPTIYGDGLQTRDFTFVGNVVEANLLACDAPYVAGKVFNVACGSSYTLNELYGFLRRMLNKDIDPIYAPERPGDVKHSLADILLARENLLYKPGIDFEQGLQITAQTFLEDLNR